jgi:hypothetical protein
MPWREQEGTCERPRGTIPRRRSGKLKVEIQNAGAQTRYSARLQALEVPAPAALPANLQVRVSGDGQIRGS